MDLALRTARFGRAVAGVLRRRLSQRLHPARGTVVVVIGPGQEWLLPDCVAAVPASMSVLICPYGEPGAAPRLTDPPRRGATLAVLPPEPDANSARNAGAARARLGEGGLVFLEVQECLSNAAPRLLAKPPAPNGWFRAGPPHRLSCYVFGREAVPHFEASHAPYPQASLPTSGGQTRPGLLTYELESRSQRWGVPFGHTPAVARTEPGLTAVIEAGAGAAWLPGFLADTLPVFLDDLWPRDAGAPVPGNTVAAALADLDATAWSSLPAEDRLRVWLLTSGRVEELTRLTAARWYAEGQAPTVVRDGRLLLDLGVPDVPDDVAALPVTFEALLARVRREGDGWVFTVFSAIRWLDFAEHPPHVTAEWVADSGKAVAAEVTARLDPAASRHFRQWFQCHDSGAVEIALRQAPASGAERWSLRLSVTAAGITATGWVGERERLGGAGVLEQLAAPLGALTWGERGLSVAPGGRSPRRRPGAWLESSPVVSGIEVTECAVGSRLGLVVSGGHGQPRLRGPDIEVAGELTGPTTPAAANRAEFSLVQDPWGRGTTALERGTWTPDWGGDLRPDPELAGRLPLELRTPAHRLRITRAYLHFLQVATAPPLADDELGPWAQQRLRSAYAEMRAPLDPELALFTSYAGTRATDSPLAIYEELRRRGTGHRVLWAVDDHSVQVPPGAEPVVRFTKAWFEALATAGIVVTNVEMERWFRRRPGQHVVQTFHGYPSKTMGQGLWRTKNISPARIDQLLTQTSRQWSLLLTPAPEMDRHYREQYDYTGEILNQGYPRDDELVGSSAELTGRRIAARQRLGIAEGRTAVLYAPTWRDQLATNFRAAPWIDHLDLDRAAEALGDDYLLLVRGHRFHRPPATDRGGHLLDVTTYPEINDLIHACDAAVLDYSSLRFDTALARRPAVFLVPDLADYAGENRGFLFPFTESVYGPLVATTDEVVAHLGNLPALAAAYADDLKRFNARFNAHQDGRSAARVVDRLLAGPPAS